MVKMAANHPALLSKKIANALYINNTDNKPKIT